VPDERNHKWVRPDSAQGLEALAFELEARSFLRTRRKVRVPWGSVDYLLHVLLGVAPNGLSEKDSALLDDLLDVIEERDPEAARWLRGRQRRLRGVTQ